MSLIRATRFGFSTVLAVAAGTLLAAPAVAQDAPAATPVVAFSGGIDVVNRYMFRGIRQNSEGMATWPWFDFGVTAFEGDGGLKKVGINVGTWNSAHSKPGSWYESDVYATLGLGFGGGVSIGTTYTSYTSPDDLFTHVKELAVKLSVDDSAYLGAGALKPYALFAAELSTEPGMYQADGGLKGGKYLELGVAPGYSGSKASLAIPLKVGLSVGDYYELNGVDNKFGFFSAAGIVTVPMGSHWNVHGGVEVQALGDTTEALNGGDSSRVIGSFGIGFAY
jgi:uncharacterized protein (TIGR02001 family)